ncbi:MarR family transcriptional regulator [Candidatus Bathyarchaeota archaeon]|nr:MarR family transcriptional regulator [Candidatus Brockarchaeota archaeon]MBS7618504.1 MarR family transcriptional regulator [Candidatus Bathyarchaeota archaeon]
MEMLPKEDMGRLTMPEEASMKNLRLKDVRSLMVLAFVHRHPGSSIREVAKGLRISYKTSQRYLRELRGGGLLIIRLGSKDNVQRFYPNISPRVKEVLSGLEKTVEAIFKEEDESETKHF